MQRVAKRGSEILKAKGFTAVFPAGKALCDHLHDWFHGTQEGVLNSMAVCSDGSYGIEKDIYFSLPIQCLGNFKYKIVQDV